jgi:hypothetical protein
MSGRCQGPVRQLGLQCAVPAQSSRQFWPRMTRSNSWLAEHRVVRVHFLVKRLWRSMKYERVYLKAYDSVSAACVDIAD